MSNSLRDQLLGLGYKPAPAPVKPDRGNAPARPQRDGRDVREGGAGRPGPGRDAAGPGRRNDNKPRDGAGPGRRNDRPRGGVADGARTTPPDAPRKGPQPSRPRGSEMDLGKAYALRAQTEKDERIAVEREKQEAAKLRREARAKLTEFLAGRILNDANAEIARHFPYGGKIKRIHVNPQQLQALNRGELGVLQQEGRYLLVDRETLDAAEAIFAPALALRVDPDAAAGNDPYADPAYQVPDDLVW